MSIDILVNQNTPPSWPDGSNAFIRTNRRGELVVPDYNIEIAAEGRAFQCSNTAKQTALLSAIVGVYSDTTPGFSVDIPTGITMIPKGIRMTQGGSAATNYTTVLVTWDSANRYSSSGTKLVSQSLRRDAPYASALTWYSLATVSAKTQDNLIWGGILKPDTTTAPMTPGYYVDLSDAWDTFPVLVGPASLLIYVNNASGTGMSFFYNFRWIEFPTVNVT